MKISAEIPDIAFLLRAVFMRNRVIHDNVLGLIGIDIPASSIDEITTRNSKERRLAVSIQRVAPQEKTARK